MRDRKKVESRVSCSSWGSLTLRSASSQMNPCHIKLLQLYPIGRWQDSYRNIPLNLTLVSPFLTSKKKTCPQAGDEWVAAWERPGSDWHESLKIPILGPDWALIVVRRPWDHPELLHAETVYLNKPMLALPLTCFPLPTTSMRLAPCCTLPNNLTHFDLPNKVIL